MATQEAMIRDVLSNDGAWTAIFGTRTYIADDLPRTGLTLSNAVKDADGVTLLPHAVLVFGTSRPNMIILTSETRDFELYLYEDSGFANVRAGKRLAKALLHQQVVGSSDNENLNLVRWMSDFKEYYDPSMNNAPASFSRFTVTFTRS